MGYTYADITILNAEDETLAFHGIKQVDEIRSVSVRALVDSGAMTLVISDKLKEQLGLRDQNEMKTVLANGQTQLTKVVGPVKILFQNRQSICYALEMPGVDDVLLGVIPIEAMDVIIDPMRQQLMLPPDRPYVAQTRI